LRGWARTNGHGVDELYVLARRVLLDALYALGLHRDAVIVVGAHAVYMRAGDADLAVAPHTTDGDLAIEPAALGETPPLEQAFTHAGFLPRGGDSVGVWITYRPTSAVSGAPGAPGFQGESGVKAQGRSSSIFDAGCPATMASRVALR